MILLIDDTRSFRDNRDAIIARNSREAIQQLEAHPHFSEIWLDFNLKQGDDILPVLRHLIERKNGEGSFPVINHVYLHTSSDGAIPVMKLFLEKAGLVEEVERVYPSEFLTEEN